MVSFFLSKFDVLLFRAREGGWGAERKKDSPVLGKKEDNLHIICHLKIVVIVLLTKNILMPFAKQTF